MIAKALPVLFLVLLLTGCASMGTQFEFDKKATLYPGVQLDCKMIGDAFRDRDDFGGLMRFFSPLFMLDLPFSFVADTLLIPYDLVRIVQQQDNPSEPFHSNQGPQ